MGAVEPPGSSLRVHPRLKSETRPVRACRLRDRSFWQRRRRHTRGGSGDPPRTKVNVALPR
jgi:hypothetical protein